MGRKKSMSQAENKIEETTQETPQVLCNNVAYTIVENGDRYNLLEIKFNAKEKKLGEISVVSTDDRYQIEEELMLKIEDMLYDI